MVERRLVTIEELEMMSPDERRKLHDERLVTDLSQVDPEFLQRAKADVGRGLQWREALDSSK